MGAGAVLFSLPAIHFIFLLTPLSRTSSASIMRSTSTFLAIILILELSVLFGSCARVSSEVSIESKQGVPKLDVEREEESEDEDGEVEEVEEVENAEDLEDEQPSSKGQSSGKESTSERDRSKAVCCKCGQKASNDEVVYSCSVAATCRRCRKYGGEDQAETIPARGACRKGTRGQHTACKNAFQRL